MRLAGSRGGAFANATAFLRHYECLMADVVGDVSHSAARVIVVVSVRVVFVVTRNCNHSGGGAALSCPGYRRDRRTCGGRSDVYPVWFYQGRRMVRLQHNQE